MSQILESLENARQEREQNTLPSSSIEKLDKTDPFDRQVEPKYGAMLNPVVWLIILLSIFSTVFIAMQYDLTGPEIIEMLRQFLAVP